LVNLGIEKFELNGLEHQIKYHVGASIVSHTTIIMGDKIISQFTRETN